MSPEDPPRERPSLVTHHHKGLFGGFLGGFDEDLMMDDRWLRPGTRVVVGEDIHGVIDRVIFCRDREPPIYAVEWWNQGELRCEEFHAADVTAEQR